MKDETYILIQEDKERAFRKILSEHKEIIYWQVRKMVLDHEDANDVTQEVFIKAWNNLDKFKGESKISTWLHRIAFNQCYTFLEKKKKHSHEDILDYDIKDGVDLSGVLIAEKLLQALGTLPTKQRLVFSLKYFDEMKYEEMSELLDTSIGALKASYHHAVQKIKVFVTQIKPLEF